MKKSTIIIPVLCFLLLAACHKNNANGNKTGNGYWIMDTGWSTHYYETRCSVQAVSRLVVNGKTGAILPGMGFMWINHYDKWDSSGLKSAVLVEK